MMPVETLNRIIELTPPNLTKIDGVDYSDKQLLKVVNKSKIELIEVCTLTGLANYITSEIDEHIFIENNMFIFVKNHSEVYLVSNLDEKFRSRDWILKAKSEPSTFRFDSFYRQEDFIIQLHTNFVMDENVENLLQLVSNVEERDSRISEDDGISQVVTSRMGKIRLGDVVIQNPITLKPYRTFREIEQPEGKYVLRANEDFKFALFTAEGEIWKLEAIKKIKAWLETAVGDMEVIG